MDRHRVFVVGDSVFAMGIAQNLIDSQAVTVVGTAPTLEAALPQLQANSLDALIIAAAEQEATTGFGPLLATCPELVIIRTDLSSNQVQVISSRWIQARHVELIEVINALPRRT